MHVTTRAFILLAVTALAACGRGPAPAAAPDAATPPAATASVAAAPAAAPAAAAPGAAAAAPATPAGESNVVENEGGDPGSAALERTVSLPPAAQLPAGKWTAGTNYRVISPAQPTDAGSGKVEVLEIFWYACPHCYALEPYIESWKKRKAPYIEFVRVPVMWGPIHRAHAQLYYTLKALGKLETLNTRAFQEVHRLVELKKPPLVTPGDDAETLHLMSNWAASQGINAREFTDAWNSFSVNKDLQTAEELTRRYRVEGVPLFIVNGKYLTDVGMAGGQANLVSLLDDLAASEKRP
ncbi:MAG: thiol:disulfide interchange protein DsbA/DsbL [Gammaproteobacteria bacterium]|nr:thiol:disulfide interchange protein DsbA/DsbL [Gammaproteobacteria bacterium]